MTLGYFATAEEAGGAVRRAVAGGAGGEVFLAKLCSRFAAEGLTLKNSYAGFFFWVSAVLHT